MPRTGLAFLVGAVAICGLPPLNGLVSELLVYLGLFRATLLGHDPLWLVGVFAAPALALVGALAVACFVKVFGAVFLGTPRSDHAWGAEEALAPMLAPMAVLAAACFFIGSGSVIVVPILDRAIAAWSGLAAPSLVGVAPLVTVSAVSGALLLTLLAAGAWLLRSRRSARRDVGTWDCGYAAPSARMQYTASSFADSLVQLLGWALRPETHPPRLGTVFPGAAQFHSHVPDVVLDRGVRPAFTLIGRVAARLRPLQRGNVHLYLLYIVATLLALLFWR
jgi:hydrogenase-4 component B